MDLRKWTFKERIRNRSRGKHQNKWNRLGAAKVLATTPARAENSEPTAFLSRRGRFMTMSKGVVEPFVSR
jgi:hypothetical protein